MTATVKQIRRGTAAENDAFTGAIGEVTMDTTNKTLRVHDGETMGGTKLARISDIPTIPHIPTNTEIAHNAMPSTTYETIIPPAINTEGTYIAPADGYMVMAFDCAPNKYYWLVNSHVGFLGVHAYGSAGGTAKHRIWIPISKNQEARFNIEQGVYDYLRFYYANGSL